MIICTKCQRTYNPLAFFGPYRNQVPIFSGSLLRNSTISHSAGMLKPYYRSITNIKKVQPAPHWGGADFYIQKNNRARRKMNMKMLDNGEQASLAQLISALSGRK